MNGLSLQIDSKWAVLSQGDSVNIQNNSPVWGEGNSFSLPFQLDIEANRHILGNVDQITGQSVYEVLDGKRAVLYTLGIPVYYGKIKMEDQVELSQGKVDVTLVSGNLTFDEMIDGMNCQDVELLDSFEIGTELRAIQFQFKRSSAETHPQLAGPVMIDYEVQPKRYTHMVNSQGQSTINLAIPYPEKKYCNVPVCTPKKDAKEYLIFEADRAASGICFYVLYFLDCLFAKLGIDVQRNDLYEVEDMKRLAFFSTACEYTSVINPVPGGYLGTYGITGYRAERKGKTPIYQYAQKDVAIGASPLTSYMYATSKNFPNTDVSDIIEGLKNAFGMITLYNESTQEMELLLARNIFNDKELRSVYAEIYETYKVENDIVGFELGYSGGDDENTSFNYSDYTNVNTTRSYAEMRKNVTPYDKTLYIDTKTGDGFRIKIDEEALSDSEKELNPSLFEVGEFVSAKYGDCSNEDCVEKKEIPFNPIISNDVSNTEGVSEYKVFLDVDMGEYGAQKVTSESKGSYGTGDVDMPGDLEDYVHYTELKVRLEYDGYDWSNSGNSPNGSPINQYDAGFTLGFIRPGEGSAVVDDEQNYDGEGNYKYYFVAGNSAFISDTIDHYGNVYDYNGQLDGGVDQSERISLKPRAEKPNPNAKEGEIPFYPITDAKLQRRGLFDKFYSEYAYFVVNRKIVRMKCRMEMADLLNIDWTKRYKIGEYVGFINKYSYSVSSTGISDVELEMYYI